MKNNSVQNSLESKLKLDSISLPQLQDGITEWIEKWKRNGWKTGKKELVKNIDLWRKLDALIEKHKVQWSWVKAHNGHRENID